MSRTVPVLAAIAAVAVLAARRGPAAALLRHRRGGRPQEQPAPLADLRGPTTTALPPRAETPAEVAREFYTDRTPAE